MNARLGTLCVAAAVAILAAAPPARAFNGHVAKEGPVTVTIGEIADVTALDEPRDVTVAVRNDGETPLTVRLRMGGLVDEWRAVGETVRQVEVAGGRTAKATFQIAAGRGACSALYPVHVYATFGQAGREVTAHAVQVFRSSFPRRSGQAGAAGEAQQPPLNLVPAGGALLLADLRTQQVAWQQFDKPLVHQPVGWEGSADGSRASFHRRTVTRGATRRAIEMHPPWTGGAGTLFATYRLKLPDCKPIVLRFANAIRDHSADEPPSDGVTFRVWAGDEKLFERHTDSKTWLDGQADLSRFAGREITLRLESHPGPKGDTTCDSCYWGEPSVEAGEPPRQLTPGERAQLRDRAVKALAAGKPGEAGELVFALTGDCAAAVVPGRYGLADAVVAFGAGDRRVVFDGLRMSVLGQPVGRWPSQLVVRKVEVADAPAGGAKIVHRCSLAGEEFDLTAHLRSEGAGLRVRLECAKRITDIALGPADRKAPRVYYGHGYCIVEPKSFRAGFGGHNLSTSHVGFDFEGGLSLLTACNHPPDHLEVSPPERLYALHTHLDATLTFVPSPAGAFDAARRYRPLFDKKPAPGVKRKAGRFVFDIWGGRYDEIAATMGRMIAYGLTDSLLTVHDWQRWGYDYRLPDIYPPNPAMGSVADVRKIADVCAAADIPWGLHDNYIDFYPDANAYTYDDICFTADGQPVQAWYNRYRDARSYRWRPDRIMPFVQRNLRLIKAPLRPTHYFIDVFTSLPCFDYHDKAGEFHSMLETRRCWGEAFAWIREYLGSDAPTTSEAGHDQLVGYLDGADCQHLRLSPTGASFCIGLRCGDWERVPWFDAVLHDKFSLHGVGYSTRYEGGRSRGEHGIESDDYVSAEVLTGHALMIDRRAFGRGAVRKYWLAQDLIRLIAMDEIAGVEFVGGDIHRQIITWRSGARVCVNRGEKDWTVAGRTLPQYGYHAAGGPVESAIERVGGVIVEQSRGPGRWYVNARGFRGGSALQIRPTADRIEYLGGRRFKLVVNWQVDQPAPKDLAVFLHFADAKSEREDKIAFQGDARPAVPTSQWKGAVQTGADRVIEVPAGEAREYDVLIGMWDPSGGGRYALLGDDDGQMRYRLGRLIVDREGDQVKGLRLVKHQPAPQPPPRWNVQGVAVDFGPAVTTGAFRCERKAGLLVLTPLPDGDAFAVALRLAKLPGGPVAAVESIDAVDQAGRTVRKVDFETAGGLVTFQVRPGEFAYHLKLAARSQGRP